MRLIQLHAIATRASICRTSVIEIELGRGRRLRVDAQIDAAALARIIGVLVACDGAYRYAARLLWINHDKPSSDARRHAPKLYE